MKDPFFYEKRTLFNHLYQPKAKSKVKRNKVVPSRMGWKMAGKVLSFPWDEEELIKI